MNLLRIILVRNLTLQSVYANMLQMYSYYTNYVMSSDINVEAETGFFIKNVTVVFMEKNQHLNLY